MDGANPSHTPGPELVAGSRAGDAGTHRRLPSRGMYVLPSLFTAGNIAAGFYAILQSIHGAMGEGPAYGPARTPPSRRSRTGD